MFRILIFLFCCSNLFAQSDPSFSKFEGDVFRIPAKHVMNAKFKFSEKIYEYENIGSISWDSIYIPSTTTDHDFPNVSRLDQFGMVLESEMNISKDGCYSFVLSSDDGSVFWIDEQEVVNNDGTHPMRARADSVYINKGKYPVRLWYYQGFKHKYGFIFKANFVGNECPENFTQLDNDTKSIKEQKLSFLSPILFDYNSSKLKEEAFPVLDSLIQGLDGKELSEISIYGYTCNRGEEQYNQNLSQKRADALRDYLMVKRNWPGLVFRSIGMGEQSPIASNESEEERVKNRRVEVIFK